MNKELREKVARMDNSDTATVGEAYDALEDYIRHVPELLDRIEEIHDAASDVLYWFGRAGTSPVDLEEQEASLQRLSLAVSECEVLGWSERS